MKKSFLLIIILFFYINSLLAESGNNSWYRRNTIGYFHGYNLNRLVVGEIVKGNKNVNLGFGITIYESLILKNNNLSLINNFFPINFYFAYPFGRTNIAADTSKYSEPGRIVIFPKYGTDQYSAAFYLIFRSSFIGYSYFENNREWILTTSIVAGFEKALPYQLSLSIEGGYTEYFIPSEKFSEELYFFGVSFNLFSKWAD